MDDMSFEQATNQITSMPVTLGELMLIMRCLCMARDAQSFKSSENEVVIKVIERISRFAERHGAFWDSPCGDH